MGERTPKDAPNPRPEDASRSPKDAAKIRAQVGGNMSYWARRMRKHAAPAEPAPKSPAGPAPKSPAGPAPRSPVEPEGEA